MPSQPLLGSYRQCQMQPQYRIGATKVGRQDKSNQIKLVQ